MFTPAVLLGDRMKECYASIELETVIENTMYD